MTAFTTQQITSIANIIALQVETKHDPKRQQMSRMFAHAFVELLRQSNAEFDSWSFLRACGLVQHATPADEGIAAARREDAERFNLWPKGERAIFFTQSEWRTIDSALRVAAEQFSTDAWRSDRDNAPRIAEQFRKQRSETLDVLTKLDEML